jgi:hypothetical protein
MQFQERDGAILAAIYEYGGVLARRHLKSMFWPEATLRAALKRLAKLVDNGYLARPTTHQRKTQPIPEPVYWLGWKGILWIAAQTGAAVEPPTNQGENQMRRLARRLRDRGIRWLREPRWIQLAHDLAVVDFRLAVERAVGEVPALRLEQWIHESEFRSDGDTVEYRIAGRDGKVRQAKKRVYPDSYFVVVDEGRLAQGLLARARFLLELDHATHANERFGREKVAPGLAYVKSPEYKARFGENSGRWLVVTTGRVRMRNLMRQTRQVAGAGVFLFTTFDWLDTGNVLTDPVWRQVGREEPMPLLAGYPDQLPGSPSGRIGVRLSNARR